MSSLREEVHNVIWAGSEWSTIEHRMTKDEQEAAIMSAIDSHIPEKRPELLDKVGILKYSERVGFNEAIDLMREEISGV